MRYDAAEKALTLALDRNLYDVNDKHAKFVLEDLARLGFGVLPAQALAIPPNGVVVLRGFDPEDDPAASELLAAWLVEQGRTDVLIVHLAPDASLSALDEDDMRAAGWVRAVDADINEDDPEDSDEFFGPTPV